MPRSLAQIASRSIDAMGRTAALGDLFRIYAYAQREGGSFHWITIPRDVNMVGDEVFDRCRSALRPGAAHGRRRDPWFTQPPGQRAGAAP